MKRLTNSTTSESNATATYAWLQSMPLPVTGKVRVNVPLELEAEELGILAGIMMKQRASLTAIVAHALWNFIEVGQAEAPIDGVFDTANRCAECRDFDLATDPVIGLESGQPTGEAHCIECGHKL